jgi:hypothetical protein
MITPQMLKICFVSICELGTPKICYVKGPTFENIFSYSFQYNKRNITFSTYASMQWYEDNLDFNKLSLTSSCDICAKLKIFQVLRALHKTTISKQARHKQITTIG